MLTFLLLLSERGVLDRLAFKVAPVFEECSSGAVDDFRPIWISRGLMNTI